MYCPQSFHVDDVSKLHQFICQHSFATLITYDGETPFASHVPLLLDEQAGRYGRLIGHVAKANPQWRHAGNGSVLAIFHGPHAYISPSWYGEKNVVPTWNYTTVHARGPMTLITDRDELHQVIRTTVEVYEADQQQPWSLDSVDDAFLDELSAAIVGFTIDIEHLEGKWKLSQNHAPSRRTRVMSGLQQRNQGHDAAIGRLMGECVPVASPES